MRANNDSLGVPSADPFPGQMRGKTIWARDSSWHLPTMIADEHQRLAATVFAKGNRPLAFLSGVPEQDRPAAQSTPAKDLGL
jgi:hypothetical protein